MKDAECLRGLMRKQALREEWKESGCRLKGCGGGGYLSLQLCQ